MKRFNVTQTDLSKSQRKSQRRWRSVFWIAIIILLINLATGTLIAFRGTSLGLQAAVVKISIQDGGGTGFFIAEKYVLTAAHVAGDVGNEVTLENAEGLYATGKVVASGYSEWKKFVQGDRYVREGATPHDWALIEVAALDRKLAALTLGASGVDAEQGKSAYLAGHPAGQDLTVTKGIISRVDVEEIHTDAELDAGFSGGPMIVVEGDDPPENGLVIGIIVSSPTNLTTVKTAVPIDIALQKCAAKGFQLY